MRQCTSVTDRQTDTDIVSRKKLCWHLHIQTDNPSTQQHVEDTRRKQTIPQSFDKSNYVDAIFPHCCRFLAKSRPAKEQVYFLLCSYRQTVKLILFLFILMKEAKVYRATNMLQQQEALEKCWAHSPRETPHAHSAGVATGTVARRLRIDVHDDNDNAWQTGPLWPHRMGPMKQWQHK